MLVSTGMSGDRDKLLHELIRLIYESALDSDVWPVFLERYAKATGSQGAGLMVQDFRGNRGNLNVSWGFDPYWEARYAEHYSQVNVWIQSGQHLLVPGGIFNAETTIATEDLVATEFYNDFLKPQGHLYSMAGVISQHPSQGSYLMAVGSPSKGSFTASDEAILLALMPHLQTAMRTHQRLSVLSARLTASESILDQLDYGVLLLDAGGKVLFANRMANAALKSKDGLWLGPEGVHVYLHAEHVKLRALMREAAMALDFGQPSQGAMMVTRANGRAPLSVLVAPLPHLQNAAGPAMVLFVTALDWCAPPDPRAYEEIFKLTRMEARLAAALASGKTVQEFTREAGVTLNTTRTHLKRMYAKLGIGRQQDLVRLLLTLKASRRAD